MLDVEIASAAPLRPLGLSRTDSSTIRRLVVSFRLGPYLEKLNYEHQWHSCGDLSPKVENAIRTHLRAGNGILKVAAMVGCGSGTVQRVKRELAEELREAA